MSLLNPPTATKESVNIEDLVDDFVIFYVAGAMAIIDSNTMAYFVY